MTDVSTGALPQSDAVDARPAAGLTLLLKHAEQVVKQRLQPLLDEVDLTLDHWRIMSVLLVQPGLTMTTIADSAVVPAATLTRLVDRLAEQAIIVRRIDAADKRRAVVALSPRGQTLARRLRAAEQSVEVDLVSAVGTDRSGALMRDLAVLPHVAG
ncbi:MarR family winged helix-turn-helix transcriptional regulator [Nocardioides cavernaquae]|uniref:MarR family transcriptional regulator n=1 Tax=Nocardioides cavernaquae TaxID=2321396 RepID=A0A3A5HJG8_9ACTN|nr:MarR family transcriptional regulator [Nocardioides cavernaquae]RJS47216.1 MarR family transcriptional regulator [Nocardioides cavernaquae]RJS48018.1 MarR family transcriptional regulator [Nocardioides cavernaquae]RJS48020.1 MarR family transcriptional regulator [Nocardioides cavernaquae]